MVPTLRGFPCGSVGKESAFNVGDPGLIPGLGRSPGEGNGNPLQYSFPENLMDCSLSGSSVHGITRVRHDLAAKLPPPPPRPEETKECGIHRKKRILSPNRGPGERGPLLSSPPYSGVHWWGPLATRQHHGLGFALLWPAPPRPVQPSQAAPRPPWVNPLTWPLSHLPAFARATNSAHPLCCPGKGSCVFEGPGGASPLPQLSPLPSWCPRPPLDIPPPKHLIFSRGSWEHSCQRSSTLS